MSEDKLRVYITIDTETSMGGAWRNPAYAPLPVSGPIFGEYKAKYYGIPLIMDILEEFGFRATFFTEVFCGHLIGYDQVEKVLRAIIDRGHDAQLHLHPIYHFYREALRGGPRREIDLMFQLSESEQHDLIGEGVALFQKLSGVSPRAYRAGCYGGSETTLRVLKSHGIEIDSSYNLAYLNLTCGFKTPFLNSPVMIEGVREFPVTVFRVPGAGGYKPLEISAVSVAEMLGTLRHLRQIGCRDAVMVLHSFSLLKNQGIRYEGRRPDNIVIRRFRKLCAALASLRDEIEVTTLGNVDLPSCALGQPQLAPTVGVMWPMVRKLVQGVNRLPWI
jgi:peptidoglycan/xylan/chitin deacetylase (PgdA/CDA1 family)